MSEDDKVFTPWPEWTRMPDPITKNCVCGRHPRSWTLARLRKAFIERNRHILTGEVVGGLNSDLNDRRARRWRRK